MLILLVQWIESDGQLRNGDAVPLEEMKDLGMRAASAGSARTRQICDELGRRGDAQSGEGPRLVFLQEARKCGLHAP